MIKMQRRLAADILKVGKNRVWISPEFLAELELVATREEIRKLIHENAILKRPDRGQSRGRWRKLHEKRKKGKRKGPGKRKGKRTARLSRKRAWIMKIRAIRKVLRQARDSGEISPHEYRKLYRWAKGGMIRSKAHARQLIEEIKKERGV